MVFIMKELLILICVFSMTTFFFAGCGSTARIDEAEDIDGSDWRTTRYFTDLEWNTPDGKTSLLAAAYEDYGVIILAPDQEKYDPFPDCPLSGGIHDISVVENSMKMDDVNKDGYDDLCVDDVIDGKTVSEVFLYDPDTNTFKYSA